MNQRNTQQIENYVRDLRFKNYSENTIIGYVVQIKLFSQFFNHTEFRRINTDQIKDYLLCKININSRKYAHSAIKLLYKFTVGQKRKFDYIEYSRKPKTEPILLSHNEIQRMFDVCKNKKHLAILATLYSTGIRRQELIDLKISDFDKGNRVIYIRHGKGNVFRKVPYNEILRKYLASYYNAFHPQIYLFENPNGGQYSGESVLNIVKKLAVKAGISKRVYTHLLRHQTLTALCEQKENLEVVKEISGHKKVSTLSTYIHLSSKIVSNVETPLNFIAPPKTIPLLNPQLQLPCNR